MPPPLIAAENLTRKYVMGDTLVTALDRATLSVERGEMAAIVGRSGSGKSTLLHLLGGLDRPTSGDVIADGRRLAERSDDDLADYRRSSVGFIFQFFNLVPTLQAIDNVALPLVFGGVAPAERERRAAALLTRVGLGERTRHRPGELSGGEQQRVAIARALANGAPLLIADEPTGNLDTHTAAGVMSLLQNLNREEGLTVVLVTHDRDLAQRFCRRTVELSDGRIVADRRSAS
jgi:putative ABC transport system ATP-binding protein